MAGCPACGKDLPGEFPFCPFCGAALTVSVLFCDLVGFTAASDAADPEQTAEEWERFGDVPERAYALLGQGRCLHALGRGEAEQPLRLARELFALLGYRPALEQTEALLHRAQAAAN